jgi:hypothetical protein
MDFDIARAFDYENGFYLTSSVQRIGKFEPDPGRKG